MLMKKLFLLVALFSSLGASAAYVMPAATTLLADTARTPKADTARAHHHHKNHGYLAFSASMLLGPVGLVPFLIFSHDHVVRHAAWMGFKVWVVLAVIAVGVGVLIATKAASRYGPGFVNDVVQGLAAI